MGRQCRYSRPPNQGSPDPLEFGISWSDTTAQTITFAGSSFNSTITRETEVTGYGELITPEGSAEALRLRQVQETTTSGTTTTTTTVMFVTKNGLDASITLDGDGNPTAASYSNSSERTSTARPSRADVPERFELIQNYPNSFNPETVIPYTVSEASAIQISVHDMLGRRVKVLRSKHHAPGRYEVVFNGAGLPSGVYVYRLTAGSQIRSRRMTLLK